MPSLGDARNLVHMAVNYRGRRRWLAREYFFITAKRLTPNLSVRSDGMTFIVSTADDMVSRSTFLEQRPWAVDDLALVVGSVPPIEGRTVIEIGANIGTTTIPLLVKHRAARVVAVEPARPNAELVAANAAANGVSSQVSLVRAALAAEDGEVTFEYSPTNWGDHRIRVGGGLGDYGEERWETEAVRAISFNTLLAAQRVDPASVGLVWMDIQGYEGHVLEDVLRLVPSAPVLAEFWPYGLHRAGGLERFLDAVNGHAGSIHTARDGVLASSTPEEVRRLASTMTAPADSADLLLMP